MSGLICGCNRKDTRTPRRYLMCRLHWEKLPVVLRRLVRITTVQAEREEENKQTLRAQPDKEWIRRAKAILFPPKKQEVSA